MSDDDALREALRRRAADAIATGGREAHPEAEELLAYLADELDSAAEAALQDHLVGCRRCAGLALDLEPLIGAASPGDGTVDLAQVAAWRELALRRRADAARGRWRLSAWRSSSSLAAVLAAAVVGLSLWVAVLSRRPPTATATQANVPIHYLDELARSRSSAGTTVDLPPGQGFWVLVLTPPDGARFPRYAVDVVTAGGEVERLADDLELTDHGTLRLGLRGWRIPPGRHRVRLFGVATAGAAGPGTGQLLDELPLEVRRDAPS